MSYEDSNKLLNYVAFSAGMIWSQEKPKRFIEFPLESTLVGVVNGGLYLIGANCIIHPLKNKNFNYLFAGLIATSSIIYLIKNIKN